MDRPAATEGEINSGPAVFGRARQEADVKLSDFKVLTFDCYGTLIDWESGMIAALSPPMSVIAPTRS